jgi:tetratricopeptide (TPR) repeat protein
MDIESEAAQAWSAFAAGDLAQAAECARRILAQVPSHPGALTLWGRLALASGEPDVAHDAFVRVLNAHPESAASWLDLALAQRDLNRYHEAAAAALRSVERDPGQTRSWVTLGEICLSLNDREGAAEAFRSARARDGQSVGALRGLCQTEQVVPGSEIATAMEKLLGSSGLRPRERAELHYSLAQVYRKAGDRAEFIRHLLTANATQRSISPGSRAEYAAVFDRLETAFTPAALSALPQLEPLAPNALFILGMPRSGTTLVEQLLATDPAVTAGGELDYVRRPLRRSIEEATRRPFPEAFDQIPADRLNHIARAFGRRLKLLGPGSRYVTDKTPGNYHVLGLLAALFPGCRIVHLRRDAMDTCFSILQQPFDDRSPHTCDVALLAYVYARYERLMRMWQELAGDRFITVDYEQLVASPAEESRRLYDYCGLTWRESCLEFHRADAPSRTFSTTQVRQPIHAGSVGAWRQFAGELEPLRAALETERRQPGQP